MTYIKKQYKLYQVQLESPSEIYCFEIATNDYDAVDIAKFFLERFISEEELFQCNVGGYDQIGHSYKKGIIKFERS